MTGQANDALRISGASTMLPFIQEIAELHKELYHVNYTAAAGGSGAGINHATDGTSDIGMVSRALRDSEMQVLSNITVGLDTIVFIINERNPVNAINKQQLTEMFSQEGALWSRYGGNQYPIVLVNKEIGRSTLDLFEDYTGLRNAKRDQNEHPKILNTAIEVGANLEVATLVGGIPNAIGYLSLGTAVDLIDRGMPIKILKLDGIDATQENVINGTYPILRELNVVYREDNEAKVRTMLDLLLSEQGQSIIENYSFIPVN